LGICHQITDNIGVVAVSDSSDTDSDEQLKESQLSAMHMTAVSDVSPQLLLPPHNV